MTSGLLLARRRARLFRSSCWVEARPLAASGAVPGLSGALAGSHLLQGLLFGVVRADPVTHLVVALGAVAAALLAAWEPARRASGIPPAATLREE